MSTEQEPQKIVEEKIEGGVDVPGFLHNALSGIPFLPQPQPHASSWQVEEIEVTLEDDSVRKVYFVVETRIRGNQIEVYWYNLADLDDHVRAAVGALNLLRMQEQVANPLMVANKQQMENVVAQAKNSGLIIPGR